MIIEEIILGEDETDKKKKINDNLGNEVIINDTRQLWQHGILMKEEGIGNDNFRFKPSGERYQLKLFDRETPMLLSYRNLNKLLVLTKPYRP